MLRTGIAGALAAALWLDAASASAADVAHGESLYNTYCAQCHNPGGNPGPAFVALGANNPALIQAALNSIAEMQPFAPLLKPSDIDDIAAYLGVRFGGPPPPPPPASLVATPASIDFGGVTVGQSSSVMTITITNAGGSASSGLSIANTNPG
jgi:mono/diheme cytochrome c family protein